MSLRTASRRSLSAQKSNKRVVPWSWDATWKALHQVQNRVTHLTAADFRIRILVLLGMSVGNVMLGALLYRAVSGANWQTAAFRVYGVLYSIPGADITAESSAVGTFVLNLIFIFGIFIFGTVLAMITEEVTCMMLLIRSGKRPLMLFDHILLLNFNQHSVYVLRQIAAAQRNKSHPFYGKPVALLADVDKETVDANVQKYLKGYNGLELHTRMGKPFRLDDLQRVSAINASYIILLHPDSAPPKLAECYKAQTVMSLVSLDRTLGSKVVVQMPGSLESALHHVAEVENVLRGDAGGFHVIDLSEDDITSSLFSQSAVQPGVASMYKCILDHAVDPSFCFLKQRASTFGGVYSWIRRSFGPRVLVCGYVRTAGQELLLNPSDDAIVGPDDLIVALCSSADRGTSKPLMKNVLDGRPTSDDVGMTSSGAALLRMSLTDDVVDVADVIAPVTPDRAATVAATPAFADHTRVLVAGVDSQDLHDRLRSGFSQFAPKGTTITFLMDQTMLEELVSPRRQSSGRHACVFKYVAHKFPFSREALLAADVDSATSIVLGATAASDSSDPHEADARMLAAMMHVQSVLSDFAGVRDRERRPHLVAKVNTANGRSVAQAFFNGLHNPTFTFELLQLREIESAILCHVAENRVFGQVVGELLGSADGNEIYIIEPSQMGLKVGDIRKFSDITEACRLQDMTPIGVLRRQGMDLAPPATKALRLTHGDKIIVIADLW